MVEIELAKHDFYRHIFPQITKFFGFFKNSKSRSELTDKLFSQIEESHRSDDTIKKILKSLIIE